MSIKEMVSRMIGINIKRKALRKPFKAVYCPPIGQWIGFKGASIITRGSQAEVVNELYEIMIKSGTFLM